MGKITCFSPVFFLILINHLSYGQLSDQGQASRDGKFRAAVVKVNITPDHPQRLRGYQERMSDGVHDSIFHRIIALDDGETQFFLVSTDAASMSPAHYDRVAELLKNRFGINPLNFWWSLTHTHSAPEISDPGIVRLFMPDRFQQKLDTVYTNLVVKKLIDGVAEARRRLVPSRLGVGWGFSRANINRRAVDIDGKASLGMNPDGAVDRKIGLLRIDREDGTPLACIANYPVHGTVLGPGNLKISGDVAGTVTEYFEKKTGASLLFINGAAGNLAPVYSVYPTPEAGHLSQFRVLLGDKILDAWQKISATTVKVILNPGSLVVETPRKTGLGWPADLGKYTRTTDTGISLVRLPVGFLKINEDIAVWSAPAELFCEISNEIRDRSPFPYTLYFGYTNGSFAYIPTAKEWEYGGYEPSVSVFTPSASRDLTEAVLNHLQEKMTIHPDMVPKNSKKGKKGMFVNDQAGRR